MAAPHHIRAGARRSALGFLGIHGVGADAPARGTDQVGVVEHADPAQTRELGKIAAEAGVLDQLELHVAPVLFGRGRRLFGGLAPELIELQRTRILEGEAGVTHMHYRVQY